MELLYRELTYPAARKTAEQNYLLALPLGCIEQHGPHLPLDTDFALVEQFTIEGASLARERHDTPILVLPGVPYGPAPEHVAFSGTISLSYHTYTSLVTEVLLSVFHHGFRRAVIVKGCSGQFGLEQAMYDVRVQALAKGDDVHLRLLPIEGPLLAASNQVFEGRPDSHAGISETSLALAYRRPLVVEEKIRTPDVKPVYTDAPWRSEDVSESGVFSDPVGANAEDGHRLLALITATMAEEFHRVDQETRGEA